MDGKTVMKIVASRQRLKLYIMAMVKVTVLLKNLHIFKQCSPEHNVHV